MECSPEIPQPQHSPSQPSSTLQIDFSYKKFQSLITESDNSSGPIYTVHFKTLRPPHLTIKSATDQTVIGTGTLHCVSINADYSLHGHNGTLRALKRFKTSYSHLSHAFSDSNSPVPMTWSSTWGLKTWDFVCEDAQGNAVARVSVKCWGIKKIGVIEFLGEKAGDRKAREEIVVVGLTLFYCMILRSNNVLGIFGACFAKLGTGNEEKVGEGARDDSVGEDHAAVQKDLIQ